jgi:pimeloyl-ACP methyl ester carboxylesterase
MGVPVWPVEKFVTVEGIRIHYRVRGSGPAVLFLHGLMGHSFSWRHNQDALAAFFRVYALDFPGLGHSGLSENYGYSFSAAADLLMSFAREVGERRILIGGHSYGGAVALLAAARYPEFIGPLVLVAPANPFSQRGSLRIRMGGLPVAGSFMARALQLQARAIAKPMFRYCLYGDGSKVEESTLDGYLEALERPEAVEAVPRMLAAWDMSEVKAAIARVRQPVLLIWGDSDTVVPLTSGRDLAAGLNARIEVIGGCAHLVQEEAPGQVNALMRSFLLQHAAPEVLPRPAA